MSTPARDEIHRRNPGPGKASGNGDESDDSGNTATGDPGDYNMGDDMGERIGEGHDMEAGNEQQL